MLPVLLKHLPQDAHMRPHPDLAEQASVEAAGWRLRARAKVHGAPLAGMTAPVLVVRINPHLADDWEPALDADPVADRPCVAERGFHPEGGIVERARIKHAQSLCGIGIIEPADDMQRG